MTDLAAYIRAYEAGGYPVDLVHDVTCGTCQKTSFRVVVDDEEGCAGVICVACEAEFLLSRIDYSPSAHLVG